MLQGRRLDHLDWSERATWNWHEWWTWLFAPGEWHHTSRRARWRRL